MSGWKLVPIEPTADMIDAAGMGWIIRPAELRKRVRIYRAMIDAAPLPPNNAMPLTLKVGAEAEDVITPSLVRCAVCREMCEPTVVSGVCDPCVRECGGDIDYRH